jgi:molybdate transport system substrate-binding protein
MRNRIVELRALSLAAVVMVAMAGLIAPVRADGLRVLATGVFEFAVRDLAEPFKRQSGQDVSITVVNAGTAAKKLEAGEQFDIILSSSASLDALGAKGQVVPATKIDVGRMRLGVVVKQGATAPDLKTASALRAALLAAPAVAYIDPRGGGTAGAFFDKMFERLGVADQVRAKGILDATGADVARSVASGKATLGMTQASELIGAEGVTFADFLPDEMQLTTVYAAAVCANASAPQTAQAFIRFITGPIGAERLRKSGWDVAAPH